MYPSALRLHRAELSQPVLWEISFVFYIHISKNTQKRDAKTETFCFNTTIFLELNSTRNTSSNVLNKNSVQVAGMHENPSSWQTTQWCLHSCVIWLILEQEAGKFQSFTQTASCKGPSYPPVLLGVSILGIFPPQAYTIMLLQHYNSQQDSQYIAYLHVFSRNRWKDAHRLDKLNSSTKTTGILHLILSKLIIQRY